MLVISIFVLVTELVSLYQMSLAWYFLGTSRSLGSSLFHYVIYSKVDWRFQVLPYIRMATAATHATFCLCQWESSITFAAALLNFTRPGRYLGASNILLLSDITYCVVTVRYSMGNFVPKCSKKSTKVLLLYLSLCVCASPMFPPPLTLKLPKYFSPGPPLLFLPLLLFSLRLSQGYITILPVIDRLFPFNLAATAGIWCPVSRPAPNGA